MSTIDESFAVLGQGLEVMAVAIEKIQEEALAKKAPTAADLTIVCKAIITQLSSLSTHMKTMQSLLVQAKVSSCEHTEDTINWVKHNSDLLDDLEQRSLVGNITINIHDNLLKTQVGVKEDNDYNDINVLALAESISKRYKVQITPADIKSAKRVSRAGSIQVSFDLKPGSPYFTLVQAMKTKGANAKDQLLYANFTLTSRRSSMLFLIRKAHKDGVLEKYYSDYDGSLVIIKKGQQQKIRLTSVCNKSTSFMIVTCTHSELLNHLRKPHEQEQEART